MRTYLAGHRCIMERTLLCRFVTNMVPKQTGTGGSCFAGQLMTPCLHGV